MNLWTILQREVDKKNGYTRGITQRDFCIVTAGVGTAQRAMLVYEDSSNQYIVFVKIGDAASAQMAMKKLLEVSMEVLNKHYTGNSFCQDGADWVAAAQGGYYTKC